jgi:hypothetical protein
LAALRESVVTNCFPVIVRQLEGVMAPELPSVKMDRCSVGPVCRHRSTATLASESVGS